MRLAVSAELLVFAVYGRSAGSRRVKTNYAVVTSLESVRQSHPAPSLAACAAGPLIAASQARGEVQVFPKATQVTLFRPPVTRKYELQQLLAPVTSLMGW